MDFFFFLSEKMIFENTIKIQNESTLNVMIKYDHMIVEKSFLLSLHLFLDNRCTFLKLIIIHKSCI